MIKNNLSRCLALVFLVSMTAFAAAHEFRMDTDVFVGGQKEPVAETLTLFSGSQVYDFLLTAPQEVVVYDPDRGTFTLIDAERKTKTIVTTQDVLSFAFALKERSGDLPDSVFAFASKPTFEETSVDFTEDSQELTRLTLEGKPLSYVAIAQKPKFPEAVKTYRSFADWYSRLNAKRSGNLPPDARIALNRALADRGLLPVEITRTIEGKNLFGGKKLEVKSKHLINWTLSGEDRKRIDKAHEQMVTFPTISFDDYTAAQKTADGVKKR